MSVKLEVNEHYLKTYGEHKLLNSFEVKRLIRRCREGNRSTARKARAHLVLGHQKLVIGVALKHEGRGVPLDDLIQEGNIGLLRAIDKFDPERGVYFSVYASPLIKDFMQRAILAQSLPVYVPRDTHRRALRVRRVSADLSQRLGREADIDEVAEATGAERDFCEFALSPNFYGASSLDALGVESEELVDESAPDPQEEVLGLRVIK